MPQPRRSTIVCSLLLCAILLAPGPLFAQQGPPPPPHRQTTSGPNPPPGLVEEDARRAASATSVAGKEVVLPVPTYYWHHGCSPTSIGMVVGYWDTQGYYDLIPGDARTQTDAVNQAIASGGSRGNPWPAERAQNYEDYAAPVDCVSNVSGIIEDAVITAGRTPHADNSIADFMGTSRSSKDLCYGYSRVDDIGPGWVQYVNLKNPQYKPEYAEFDWGGSYGTELTWDVVKGEIDQGRPLSAVVDSNSDGYADHSVTVIGYRENPRQYGFWDTWSALLRWADFVGETPGVRWGISSVLTLRLAAPPPIQPKQWLPYLGRSR